MRGMTPPAATLDLTDDMCAYPPLSTAETVDRRTLEPQMSAAGTERGPEPAGTTQCAA